LHHGAKFRKDRSNRYGDIAIFVIFKMVAAAILDFEKFEILTVGRSNFINIGQTVAEIWQFNGFQNGGRPSSWVCEIQIFYRSERLRRRVCISVPNFVEIGQTIAEISRFL